MNNLSPEDAMIIREHQRTPPVNVVSIAHALGINVYKAEGSENISGKIVKSDDHGGKSGYAIFVNGNDALSRQRFTIAHELAHYLLHRSSIGDGIVEDALYRSGLSNKQEVEANKLAADILMPWHLINSAMDDRIQTIPELAHMFLVSESAMSIRFGLPC